LNKLLSSDWLITCNEDFTIIKDGAIVFDKQIIEVGTIDQLTAKYPNLKNQYQGVNSVLMAGLINSHIHLEFSANKTTLKYGNFIDWLNSVIVKRDDLIQKATEDLIDNELNQMLKGGTTTIGAISSYGFDMPSCVKSPLNVIYFTEVIGSKPDMIDTLFTDFKARLSNAKQNTSDSFIPAIAIHSPYSVHPFLVREVLNIAKQKELSVSAHFQESSAENEWLNYSSGEFTSFFKNFLQQTTSTGKPSEFLDAFKGVNNLSFTHCVEANKQELETIKKLNGSIIHCPNSNRLLNNTILNLDYIKDINLALGTDGLSSNNSLNLFDEMRNAFFMHSSIEPNTLSKKLILSATSGGALALGLNKGILEKGKDADIISFCLPDSVEDQSDLTTAIILHITKVKKSYIKGEQIELF
jgi:cytosine/adenosine deaminase-related metal-dependent hydrolase